MNRAIARLVPVAILFASSLVAGCATLSDTPCAPTRLASLRDQAAQGHCADATDAPSAADAANGTDLSEHTGRSMYMDRQSSARR
jgi:hypothetical protein